MTKQQREEAAVKEMVERGYKNEKKEDRHGETKAGWWSDDVFLGKGAADALNNANGN